MYKLEEYSIYPINNLKLDTYYDPYTFKIIQQQIKTHKKPQTNNNLYKNYFLYWNVFFIKIKLIGKGFRIQYFNKYNCINYTFGHSHVYMSIQNKIFTKKTGKYKYIFFHIYKHAIYKFKEKLNRVKPLNAYTLRGLKVFKLKVIKRKGRKSPNI